jgi:N-acetylglutamate synthase-like GNAT family acetyltransferase
MPADIQIRTAGIHEKRALEQLQLRASLANEGDRDHLLGHPDIISIPEAQIASALVFVAEQDGKTLGFAALLPNEDGSIELDGMFVEPELQRSGIGRRLVAHCLAEARQRGAPRLQVIANPHALAFYRSCDFREHGTTQTQFGTGILMDVQL